MPSEEHECLGQRGRGPQPSFSDTSRSERPGPHSPQHEPIHGGHWAESATLPSFLRGATSGGVKRKPDSKQKESEESYFITQKLPSRPASFLGAEQGAVRSRGCSEPAHGSQARGSLLWRRRRKKMRGRHGNQYERRRPWWPGGSDRTGFPSPVCLLVPSNNEDLPSGCFPPWTSREKKTFLVRERAGCARHGEQGLPLCPGDSLGLII